MVVSSSQPVSSQSGEMEAHFAALLEPIRDMAKNWDIDIAHHLEEYLEEVRISVLHPVVVIYSLFCIGHTMNNAFISLVICCYLFTVGQDPDYFRWWHDNNEFFTSCICDSKIGMRIQ